MDRQVEKEGQEGWKEREKERKLFSSDRDKLLSTANSQELIHGNMMQIVTVSLSYLSFSSTEVCITHRL